MKNTHTNTPKIKIALLMAVVIAVALTLAACEMSNDAVSEDDYSFVLSDTTPTEITYEQGEQASPLTITLTFDEGQSDGIYYVRWLEIYDDSVNTGVMEQFVYKLRITEDDGEVVQLPSFPNNTPVEFTYTPSTSEVGTKHYVLEAEYKYSAAVNVGSVCNSAESSKTHTERLRSEVIAVTVTEQGAPPVNNGDDSDLTLEITAEPQSANYTQNASDVSALSVEISTNATAENVTYAWYTNTQNSTTGGTAISGANSANYTPSTSSEGTFYYYCTVTAKNATEEKTATSAVATIKVGNTQQLSQTDYNFVITSQPVGGTYTAGSTAALSVTATTNSGNALSYQWFTSIIGSTQGAVAIQGATGPSFNVNTSNNSNQYYYCRVTDIYAGQTHVRNSNIANVVVTGAIQNPTPTTPSEVWVKGVQITAANAADVFASDPALSGKVKYNFATKTLTLTDARLEYSSSSLSADAYKNAVIGANTDLIVELVNSNFISYYPPSSGTETATSAISVSGSLTFTGSGDLDATAPWFSHGFVVGNNLIVNGIGSVEVIGAHAVQGSGSVGFNGANVGGTLTVGSSAEFTATGGSGATGIHGTSSTGEDGTPGETGGIGVKAAAITVNPGGNLTATGGSGGIGGFGGSGTSGIQGGSGGNGGIGGTGIHAATVNASGTLTATGGSGGSGGNAHGGEDNGSGGTGGIGIHAATVINSSGTLKATGGSGGHAGAGTALINDGDGGNGGTGVVSTTLNVTSGTATGGSGGNGNGSSSTGGTGGNGAFIINSSPLNDTATQPSGPSGELGGGGGVYTF